MSTTPGPAPGRHPANPLFRLAGAILVVAGVVAVVAGVLYSLSAMPWAPPTLGDLGGVALGRAHGVMRAFTDGFVIVIGGMYVLTAGRYLWRGARRRGWRDRLGRLVILLGYLLAVAGMIMIVRSAPGAVASMVGGNSDAATGTLLSALLGSAILILPGVLLAIVGFRLAKEKPLLEMDVKVGL